MVYVGLDVHRKRTQVAIMQEDGTEILNRNVPNDPAELSPLLGRLEPGTPVVFEAAFGWGWLVELLDDWNLEPHLAHAKGCKAIASARLKNDKVDARTLAHLLRSDLLPEAWIAPREVRDLRWLLRHRASLVRSGTALKNRIHGVLADRGIRCPIDDLWTKPGRIWLDTLELPPIHQEIVNDCLGLIDALAVPVRRLDREIRVLAKPDARVEALQQLPGIGRLTAMTLVAEIGDISRFPTARKLCAWAGLTPTVRNSDRTVRHGHITKQGSKWVRFVLGEAAHIAKRRPPFTHTYARMAQRRGKHIATVAVSRKLLARSFHILKEVNQDNTTSGEGLRAGALANRTAPEIRPTF
jgi:transposase